MTWSRRPVSQYDLPPGKFEAKCNTIDHDLDMSAALFDQHTLFSSILPLKFFDHTIRQLEKRSE